MYCPKCGSLNQDDAAYCLKCGTSLRVINIPIPTASVAEPRYASFWRRLGAYFIDYLILYTPSGILYMVVLAVVGVSSSVTPDDTTIALIVGVVSIITGLILFVGYWLYYALMTCSRKQATVGKMALGIIVTDMNGQRLTFARSNARFFATFLSAYSLYIGYLMIIWTKRKQGLHDIVAGTVVIRKN